MFKTPDSGKRRFSRLSPDQRRRLIRCWIVILVVTLMLAGAMALVMFVADRPKGFG